MPEKRMKLVLVPISKLLRSVHPTYSYIYKLRLAYTYVSLFAVLERTIAVSAYNYNYNYTTHTEIYVLCCAYVHTHSFRGAHLQLQQFFLHNFQFRELIQFSACKHKATNGKYF